MMREGARLSATGVLAEQGNQLTGLYGTVNGLSCIDALWVSLALELFPMVVVLGDTTFPAGIIAAGVLLSGDSQTLFRCSLERELGQPEVDALNTEFRTKFFVRKV